MSTTHVQPLPHVRVVHGRHKSVVDMDRHGAAADAVRAVCRRVSVLAGLPFEQKPLKRIATH